MSGFSIFTITFSGPNIPSGHGHFSLPGVKTGDIQLRFWSHGNEDFSDTSLFGTVVTVDDELNAYNAGDLSANTYTAVFLRFV